MDQYNHCPYCGRHCERKELHCERGKEYFRTESMEEVGNVKNQSENIQRMEYGAFDIDKKLIMNFRDLGHTIRFLYEGKGSQKQILIILLEAGNITQRQLTERIGIQPGSASEVIGKLESAGLIQRTPSQTDRRTTDIRLTESGRIQAEEAFRQRKIRHQEMFSCLSEEEKDTLLALLERLNTDWDSRYRKKEKEFGHGKKQGLHRHHGDFHHH